MSSALSNKYFNRYPRVEWLLMKLSLVYIWLDIVRHIFINDTFLPYPAGLCTFFDCSFLATPKTAWWFYSVAYFLSILYLFERWMKFTTLCMFLLSLMLFTLEESNGILNRCALYTMIFLAQSIAYFKAGPNLKKNRLQFAVQIVAAGYFLAGTSKLIASGPGWITDAPYAAVQIAKNYAYGYFNYGNIADMQMGLKQANFVIANKPFIIFLFGMSLVLELTAWVAVMSKRNAFIYGCLLFGMHMGIYYFMDILIVAIYYPMVIILINPLYTGYFVVTEAFYWLKNKLENRGFVFGF
ncbi:MAG TPA: hypothetical protein VK154_19065 [Chitinophagales bacterium]|nr:hypothetical protein [Chitinophagales bacterium]